MSNATKSNGTLMQRGNGVNGASTSYTTISEVKNITGPGLDKTILDVTNHSSAGYKEKLGGVKDPGQVSFEVNFLPQDPTQSFSAGLISDWVSNVKRDFAIIFTDPALTTWKFTAIIKGFAPSAPTDGVLAAKVDLDITGAPTLA